MDRLFSLRYFSICSVLASATIPIASASPTPRSPHDRPARDGRAWNGEKSRRVADAWFEEQRAAGLTTAIDASGSTLVGVDAEEYAGLGGDPAAAFGESSEAAFPEEELGRAARKLDRLSDISKDIDMWAQGYRMLGGFIDCSHSKDDEHHSQDDDDGQYQLLPCGRWMMWAAYYNPNYKGGGWQEYYDNNNNTDHANGDDANHAEKDGRDIDYSSHYSRLDCHKLDSSWRLIGVYRMEFYQFIEQLSKHLWDIDSYEYITFTSGMDYMTDSDCTYAGNDADGEPLYAGPRPMAKGYFMMGIYTDNRCLQYTDSYNYDDFYDSNGENGENGDNDDNDDNGYNQVYAQEQTLNNLNMILNSFKMCRLCMDYPTYQDGYFIGNGTDDYSLINQCWKFHSHGSFPCTADCIFLGSMQGTILKVTYNDVIFGGYVAFSEKYIQIDQDKISSIFVWSSGIIFFGMLVTLIASTQETETASHETKRSQKTQKKANEKITKESQNSEKKRSHRSEQAQGEADETTVIESDVYVSDIDLDNCNMNAWSAQQRADAKTYVPPVIVPETLPLSRPSLLPPRMPPMLPPGREGAGDAALADPPVDGSGGAASGGGAQDLLSASLLPVENIQGNSGQIRNKDAPLPPHPRLPLHPRGTVDLLSSTVSLSSTVGIQENNGQTRSGDTASIAPLTDTVDILSTSLDEIQGMNVLASHPRGTVDLLSSTVSLLSTVGIQENNGQTR
eukprot:CAMPEP_0194318488 /NCGR_PEP_ID=MMETSP0171-20130528/15081_1 /TAXON_ID=218684 /ORGANISM="Corethron pennatum, Strain L29A3" /LENGTH=730 /DNA_ID=CAMNT_0039075405 /DNA_START=290 /DNA_END=2479 /DNA_ORIENTATION=-